jgi:hypothetical protein
MYYRYFPQTFSPHWVISDDDPDNKYIELLGYNGEYLIAISHESDENEENPYFLNFQQMKGAFLRYDYTSFGIQTWYSSPKAAVDAVINLMEVVDELYPQFLPISHEMYVGLGPSSQLDQIQRSLGGVLMVSEAFGQALVFKHVQFMPQDHDLMVTALKIIKSYTIIFQVNESDFIGGILCNENGQYLGRLDFHGNPLKETIYQNH